MSRGSPRKSPRKRPRKSGGLLGLGERARAAASVAGLIMLGGTLLFGVFSFGVRYATSDVREANDKNAMSIARNSERIAYTDRKIESISEQVHRTNAILVHLATALEEPAGSRERRQALQKVREIGVTIPYTLEEE